MYRRRLLLISAAFPPSAESGTYRPLKFVKYLPEFGWQPVVITLPENAHLVLDEHLLDQVPEDVPILRAPLPPFVHRVRRAIEPATSTPIAQSPLQSAARRIIRILRRINVLLIPGLFVTWLPTVVWYCWYAHRIYHPSVVLVSVPPESVALAGAIVSSLLRIPLVVDFRDGWTVEPHYLSGVYRRTRFRYWVEGRLESWVFRQANQVICQQSIMAADYAHKYPQFASKLHVVNNGFDPDDFEGVTPFDFGRPTLLHIGNLTRRNPGPLFNALRQLREHRPEAINGVQVQFVGRSEPEYVSMVARMGLCDVVHFAGHVDHKVAVAMMKGAAGLLLLTRGDECELPGKLFEYLGAGRPIFALAPRHGEAARVIKEAQAGVIADPNDADDVINGLQRFLLAARVHGSIPREQSRLEVFTRRRATEKLASVLEVAVKHPEGA